MALENKGVPPKDADKQDSLFEIIHKQVEQSKSDRAAWHKKLDKWHKMRFRIKKQKDFPFKDSSNIRMPTADVVIKKIKSGIMGVVFSLRPIVQVLPAPGSDREVAVRIEKFLDHLFMDVIEKFKQKVEMGIDISLEKGFSLLKPYWRTEITKRKETYKIDEAPLEEVLFLFKAPRELLYEQIIARFSVDTDNRVIEDNLKSIDAAIDDIRAGKDEVSFEVQDIVYDFPDIAVIEPDKYLVPSDSGTDPQNLPHGTHEFFLTYDQIKANVETKGWSRAIIDEVDAFKGVSEDDQTNKFTKEQREGISRLNNASQLVKVRETIGWYDLNGDGIVEKAIVTTLPDFKLEARRSTLTQLSGKFPIVKLFYELTYDRWYSHRGIPEQLEDIITEIDVQHNMKIDAQTIRNAPMFVYRSGMVNPNNVQMIPNQGIAVNGLQSLDDTLKVLNLHNPNVEFSYEREEQLLESKIQELTGQVDFGLQSRINKRQPRTLGEVDAQVQNASRNFSNDVDHYTQAFSELANFIFELWAEYGKDEYEFMYFGESAQGESVKITKEEIQSKFKIKIRGNDQNVNPEIRLQKAQQILQVALNPMLIQMGIVGPQQTANGVKRFLQELDISDWEEYVITDIKPPKPPSPSQRIEPKFADLEESEQAQVLQDMGIKPDIPQRRKNSALKEVEASANAIAKVSN